MTSASKVTLVTGAPGWLGNRLLVRLAAKGRRVRCLVYPADFRPEDLAELAAFQGVEIVWGDVRNPAAAQRAVAGVSSVFHLASARTPENLSDFEAINAWGARTLALAAADARVSAFVHVSSISVHGHNRSARHPFVETSPTQPLTPYALSKLRGEQEVRAVATARGLPAVVLRPGPFYGPGQSPAMELLAKLVRQGAAPGVRPSPLRSLTHVDNVVDALLLAEEHVSDAAEPFMIGDAVNYTTRDLLRAFASAQGVKLRTVLLPIPVCRIAELAARAPLGGRNPALLTTVGEFGRHSFATIDKARTVLGYRPGRSLAEGVAEALS
ncbi:MAG: nucleoside-diphosphate-sugar epimerase [Myxococcota bacterium]|jgi:nucleoside-diphosphate-sugar epimerase